MNDPPLMTPVLGFAAYSGTGKTTLLRKLIPLLRQQGLRIGLIKHAHHSFDVDQPGKDSYELRRAGAERVLVGSRRRWALMVENDNPGTEPCLQDLLERMPVTNLDLILVEGFKHENYPRIELHRGGDNHPWLYPDDDSIIAVATDEPNDIPARTVSVLDINQEASISEFILQWLMLHNPGRRYRTGS